MYLYSYFKFIFLMLVCLYTNAAASFDKKPLNLYPKYNLVICAIFQNESLFLKEWIEYHLLLGVEHFYLFNNLSTDNYNEILSPYIESDIVELIEWPILTNNQVSYLELLQLPAYNQALELTKNSARWAAFIDLDEFIVPVQQDNLLEFLEEYKPYAAIAINWQLFGTSWIDELLPSELITEKLVWKAHPELSTNQYVKLIVQPNLVEKIQNPHYFDYQQGYYAVDSNYKPLPLQHMAQAIVIDKIKINHYWLGPKKWFLENKLSRRKKWGTIILPHCIDAFIDLYNQIKDETILRFVPKLRSAISNQ